MNRRGAYAKGVAGVEGAWNAGRLADGGHLLASQQASTVCQGYAYHISGPCLDDIIGVVDIRYALIGDDGAVQRRSYLGHRFQVPPGYRLLDAIQFVLFHSP